MTEEGKHPGRGIGESLIYGGGDDPPDHKKESLMRKVRLFSLLCAACIVGAIFVAAAPASASTVLCKKSESPCGSTQKYPGGTTINASLSGGSKSKFESGFISMECSNSTLAATTEAEAGSPIAAELTALTFGSCTAPGYTGCTAAGSNLPTNVSLADKESGNGTVSLESAGFEFTCNLSGKPYTCIYRGVSGASLSLTGGSPATLAGSEVKFETQPGSALGCSKTLRWSVNYGVSSPNPLFTSTGTGTERVGSLCKEKVTFCPAASKYSVGQALEATTSNFSFSLFGLTFQCPNNSFLQGQVEAGGGTSVNASFNNGSIGGCTAAGWTCSGSMRATGAKFTGSTGGNGTLALEELIVELTCNPNGGVSTTCKYKTAKAELPLSGGAPASLVGTNVPMGKSAGSAGACSLNFTWNANFTFNQPSPLYLTS